MSSLTGRDVANNNEGKTVNGGLDCSLLGAIGMHYAHLRLGLGLGLRSVLGLGVGLALVFSET